MNQDIQALPGAFPSNTPERLTVPPEADGLRLDRFLGDALRPLGISREKLKEAIRDGAASLNGSPVTQPRRAVRSGDIVELGAVWAASLLEPERGDLRVLYADEHIAVLDKPPGIAVHPCPSRLEGTLVHRLLHHFPALANQTGPRPGIVHRLDKDTSGLIVAALAEKDRLTLSRAFAERNVGKEYLALVRGVPHPASGAIREPIGRDPRHKTRMAVVPVAHGGREAHSEYRTLHADPAGMFSLLAVRIHTGRTHQIRVHMASLGHPLWGDPLYANLSATGGREIRGSRQAPESPAGDAPRQMLHAWKLRLGHPATGREMRFAAPPPGDFVSFALALSRRLTKVILTGSPGCGKSSLLRLLEKEGIPVWSADAGIKKSYARGGDGALLLQRRFGGRFNLPDGSVDKQALFAAMRDEDTIRRDVETLIHPLARHELALFWRRETERALRGGQGLAAAEVPLYLETGWRSESPPGGGKETLAPTLPPTWPVILVGVYCPLQIRVARMRETRSWDDATIAVMESWQWPEEKKMRNCDLVIDNSGGHAALEDKSRALLRLLRGLAAKRNARLRQALEALWS